MRPETSPIKSRDEFETTTSSSHTSGRTNWLCDLPILWLKVTASISLDKREVRLPDQVSRLLNRVELESSFDLNCEICHTMTISVFINWF